MHERLFHHHCADKLDDPERLKWLPPATVIEQLALRPGMRVADLGAGTGYFAIPMARAVSPGGHVTAVDVQPEMLERLRGRLEPELPVSLVEGEATRTTLEGGTADLVLLANVWHELDDHRAALAEVARVLAQDGRLAILDWRSDVEQPPGPPPDHRISAAAACATLADHGWHAGAPTHVGTYHYLVIATPPR